MAESGLQKLQAEYTVALPQDTLSVVVYMNTWVRLKGRIRKCRHGVGVWESLLWTMVGVFIPSAVSGLSDYHNARYFSITPWMLMAAISFVAAVIAAFGLRQAISHETDSIDAILSEMEEIQARFTKAPQ